MTTVAQVRAAWASAIWTHATVIAYTPQIYDYNLLAILGGADLGEIDQTRMLSETRINFFQYLVAVESKLDRAGGGSSVRTKSFEVQVSYFRQHDIPDTAHNAVIDALEAVDELVVTQLGGNWSNTVHHWEVTGVSPVTLIAIQNRPVWQGQILYRADAL